MGSLTKLSRLDDVEIIERYLAGESKSTLVLRTGKSDAWVSALLRGYGIPLRTSTQARRASAPYRIQPPKRKSPT